MKKKGYHVNGPKIWVKAMLSFLTLLLHCCNYIL